MEEIECLGKSLTGDAGIRITEGTVAPFPTHTHVYYEMTLYQPFSGCVTVNQSPLAMDCPTLILVTPTDFHRIEAHAGCQARYLKAAFDEQQLTPGLRARLTAPLRLRGVSAGALPVLLFEELFSRRDSAEEAAALIHTLAYFLLAHGEALAGRLTDRRHDWVLGAVRLMNARFSEPITLADVARALSLSPPYLSAIFSRTMGMTFSDYLAYLRLGRAAELLRTGDVSVTEICFRCGYRNLSHFIRSFKRRYGLSPLSFRGKTPRCAESHASVASHGAAGPSG